MTGSGAEWGHAELLVRGRIRQFGRDRADDRYRRNLVIPMGRDEGLFSTIPAISLVMLMVDQC